ncbi:MAG: aminomethyl-transferring glycine dehydrogenase [Candidatus Eisenbacteria bacterium]|nr:aminomethyl-transferring glycine dehydrogenase [Candidatus Eisenbacteria bacterium]
MSTQHDDRLAPSDRFLDRHLGPGANDLPLMYRALQVNSLDQLIDETIPSAIRMPGALDLPAPKTEGEVLAEMRGLAAKNKVARSYIGMGYHNCITPGVIQRNILENPGWYTQYTPYQAEISQGRMEALLNFQTAVTQLTAMDVANASLLDEATAAAEAMTLARRVVEGRPEARTFFVADHCHPQTIAVVRTRAKLLGYDVVVGPFDTHEFTQPTFGCLVQYPATDGSVPDLRPFIAKAQKAGALVTVATDLLALCLLEPPGEFGADIVIGNSQRFGVPLGYGGPHAAFMAVRETYARKMPGRIIGISRDSSGKPALRMALQTREQHIRREKATSNICTAQVLLAVTASMYAVYHGPEGLRRIARRVATLTETLAMGLESLGQQQRNRHYFDTLRVTPVGRDADQVMKAALERNINLRRFENGDLGIALDETVGPKDVSDLLECFGAKPGQFDVGALARSARADFPDAVRRKSDYLKEPVFHSYRTETEIQRYMKRLESRDLSLTTSMIPLGSCTMKLNAASEMRALTIPGFAFIHPFVPLDQAAGYQEMIKRLEGWLSEITGFAGCSLQPNAGSQGEYAGLLVIRAYQEDRGQGHRDICLIPTSAHGTNPASAVLAGLTVVPVACDADGNVDLADLRRRAEQHKDRLAAMMITYPSTHGVFEEAIKEITATVHEFGGQVYFDGANMNAMVGLCRPGDLGADVCHLNLHKTFCIPHGGGGPGMGPICVARHLAPFLPGHPVIPMGGEKGIGAISAAPWGSPSILTISYAYIAMMGGEGLAAATKTAILNANYIASRLKEHYPVLYKGSNGRIAHECIIDPRGMLKSAGLEIDDIAKRLVDYGFHAPTMSFPVPGTLMIEPTESESLYELDRFCNAMVAIREEIREIEEGRADRTQNLLRNAPHTAEVVCADAWDRPYSREQAAFPSRSTRDHKFWPSVGRIDNAFGDRNLCCVWSPELVEAETEAR